MYDGEGDGDGRCNDDRGRESATTPTETVDGRREGWEDGHGEIGDDGRGTTDDDDDHGDDDGMADG